VPCHRWQRRLTGLAARRREATSRRALARAHRLQFAAAMTDSKALTVQDRVLLTSNGGLIGGPLKTTLGRVELTPTHIIYYRRSRLWLMFGALGMLLSRRTAGKRALDIDLSKIASAVRSKYGFNKKVLDVKMKDGTTHRLTVDKFDDFTARLREQVPGIC
jgi:hypothetical protein